MFASIKAFLTLILWPVHLLRQTPTTSRLKMSDIAVTDKIKKVVSFKKKYRGTKVYNLVNTAHARCCKCHCFSSRKKTNLLKDVSKILRFYTWESWQGQMFDLWRTLWGDKISLWMNCGLSPFPQTTLSEVTCDVKGGLKEMDLLLMFLTSRYL